MTDRNIPFRLPGLRNARFMTVRIASLIAAAALTVVTVGCGSSSHVSAGSTGTVAGTIHATTTVAGGNGCETLRSTARRATASVARALPSLVAVRSRAQAASRLAVLRERLAAASQKIGTVTVKRPSLVRDKQQIRSALDELALQVDSARTAVLSGKIAGAAKLASTNALSRLRAATSDLGSRCASR